MEKAKRITNSSCIGKHDESNSMYFSFNTSALSEYNDKTLEGEELIIDANNSTEQDDISENYASIISTVKKSCNPSIKILYDSKMHSSTPTKYFSPRPISKRCGSLGVSLLSRGYLKENDNKENIHDNESPCTKTIKDMNLQLTQLEINNEHGNKKSLIKGNALDIFSGEMLTIESKFSVKKEINYSKDQLNCHQNIQLSKSPNEPDLSKKRSLKISDKKISFVSRNLEIPNKSCRPEILEKDEKRNQINGLYSGNTTNLKETSKFKMEKRRTIYAAYTFPSKSIKSHETKNTDENITIKRQPRFSITKTTLNSPGIINKNIRKTSNKNDLRKSNVGKTKLFNDSTRKLKIIIDNSKQESSLVLETKLTSNLKQKIEKINKESENKCKFCDKRFAIPKALQIHLLENCLKIPPAIKRKLFINDRAGEKVPTKKVNTSKPSLTLNSCSITSNESVSSNSGKTEAMPPPSSIKIKKKIPHSGIYRTPNKLLKCGLCSQNFNNVYEYTAHILSHSDAEKDFC